VIRWLAVAALLPFAAATQTAPEGTGAAAGATERPTRAARGAVPESVRVLDELIERLTDAPLYRDNDVELLLDGPQTLGAMLEAIAAAEHHVHLETYIFADDEVGAEFATALAAKARAGVPVRVIYDSIGSRSAGPEFWARLEEAGVRVREFNPPLPVEDRTPFDIDTRDHRKLLIVDGRVAFTGVLAGAGGNSQISQIWVAYQAAAKVAAQRIWITQSYFAPDEELTAAILEAAARGVDVRILVAGFSDSELLLNASRAYYADLLEAGVNVFESQEHIMHAKTMVVDGYWSTVGSSNLDYLSFLHNHEANAVILGARFAAQLEDVFLDDLEHATQIDAARWRQRSLWQRAKELGSYFIRYRL
jgi:phosphatidylserine/phosphatidylglycerophosphate/cardiolipin synthase-like enzyme